MPMERSELSEAQCLAQLGVFQFLPIEIRLMSLLYQFYAAAAIFIMKRPSTSTEAYISKYF
ncbi:hypothetical protein N7454_010044 [Penicillium verhagenii]|nr:hypothetical protein N7454_010044 [Penicillium verhagenii]